MTAVKKKGARMSSKKRLAKLAAEKLGEVQANTENTLRETIKRLESENLELCSSARDLLNVNANHVRTIEELKADARESISISRDINAKQWRAVYYVGPAIGNTPFAFGGATEEGPWIAGYGSSPTLAVEELYRKIGEAYVSLVQRP